MAARRMPKRLTEFMSWVEEKHATEEVVQRVGTYLGQLQREMKMLQHEVEVVHSISGMIVEHQLPKHTDEPFQANRILLLEREERGERILALAREIVIEGKSVVAPKDVLRKLIEQRVDMGVTYPTSVIGNVLARNSQFRRLGRNRFEYVGKPKERRDTEPPVEEKAKP